MYGSKVTGVPGANFAEGLGIHSTWYVDSSATTDPGHCESTTWEGSQNTYKNMGNATYTDKLVQAFLVDEQLAIRVRNCCTKDLIRSLVTSIFDPPRLPNEMQCL